MTLPSFFYDSHLESRGEKDNFFTLFRELLLKCISILFYQVATSLHLYQSIDALKISIGF